MDHFTYQDGQMLVESVPLTAIAATHGTPCYVYSRATLERHWRAFDAALGGREHLICFAVKANSNLGILNLLARLGSGFDVVSGGELERVIAAGGDAARTVFSGVGKTSAEMRRALELGIHCFNVESLPELARLEQVAEALGQVAPVSFRVNPDVDPKTHPYISTGLKENKFGIAIDEAFAAYRHAAASQHLEVIGIDCHIGSQLTEVQPFRDALQRVLALVDRLAEAGIGLTHIDMGGGLGIRYQDESPPLPGELAEVLNAGLGARELALIVEPGRAIVGNAGVMLTRVEYIKPTAAHRFAIVDAAMNDLLRPSLYGAWQAIEPVQQREGEAQVYDVVGPVCETGDFLGKQRQLVIQPGDLLAVKSAGAYGFTMSSNYNTRGRAAEVIVDGDAVHVVRPREAVASLFATETVLPD